MKFYADQNKYALLALCSVLLTATAAVAAESAWMDPWQHNASPYYAPAQLPRVSRTVPASIPGYKRGGQANVYAMPVDPWGYAPQLAVPAPRWAPRQAPVATPRTWRSLAEQNVPATGGLPDMPRYGQRNPAVQMQFPEQPMPEGLVDEGELYWGPDPQRMDIVRQADDSERGKSPVAAENDGQPPAFLDPWQMLNKQDSVTAVASESAVAPAPEPPAMNTLNAGRRAMEKTPAEPSAVAADAKGFVLPASGPAAGLLPMVANHYSKTTKPVAGGAQSRAVVGAVFPDPVVSGQLLDLDAPLR